MANSSDFRYDKKSLKKLRDELGLDQSQFADRLHVNVRTVMRWETGESVPTGSARKELAELWQERQPGIGPRNNLFVGVCYEFLDVSYLRLCQGPRNFLTGMAIPRVDFVPIHWDDRCLQGLQNATLDIVCYNSHCAKEFVKQTGASFLFSEQFGGTFQSGDFYIAFRLSRTDRQEYERISEQARPVFLLKTLWRTGDQEILSIVPPADMRQSMICLLEQCCRMKELGLDAPARESVQKNFLPLPPGEGLNFLLTYAEQCRWLAGKTVAYIGGQDQRTAIEQWQSTGDLIVFLENRDLRALNIFLPDDLRRNQLIARDPLVGRWIAPLVTAFEMAKKSLKNDSEYREAAKLAVARWHQLYNTRFTSQNVMDVLKILSKLIGEFETTLGRLSNNGQTNSFHPV